MFCPECGRPLPNATVRICPLCNTAFEIPEPPVRTVGVQKSCKRSVAALLFGVGTFTFGMLTLLCKCMGFELRLLYASAAVTFFLAPLACGFGVFGIAARIGSREKRGLPSAITGFLLGLAFGLLAAYCLLWRIYKA